MSKLNFSSQINSNQGSVLVELALILPIIFVISLTVFEFTRAIHHLTIASSASKEFANIIKRDCPEDSSQLPTCLNSQRTNFEEYLQSIVPGTKLAVTYMIANSDRINLVDRATWSVTPQYISKHPDTVSRLPLLLGNDGKIKTSFSNLDRHQAIVFSECYVPYSPILVFINTIFNLPFVAGDFLYDATIV